MQICHTVEEALSVIAEHSGSASTLKLAVSNRLNDELGANMAVVTDAILASGWLPDGYEDNGDHRIYRYSDTD